MTKCEFSVDWTSNHFPQWREWLGHLVDQPVVGCEIGSFEGRSAEFFLTEILTHPQAILCCIDPWAYDEEREICRGDKIGCNLPRQFDLEKIHQRFLRNVQPWAPRVRVIRQSSRRGVLELPDDSLDFAYIDGSHLACRALEDAVLLWPKMRPGGTVIFDDYNWTSGMETPPGWRFENLHPRLGIDTFLQVYHGQYDRAEIRGGQVMIRKSM